MQKVIICLIVLSCLIAVLNFTDDGQIHVFNLEEFRDWFVETTDNAPNLFEEFEDVTSSWNDSFFDGILSVLDVLVFPIRFASYTIISILDFLATFVFYNVGVTGVTY